MKTIFVEQDYAALSKKAAQIFCDILNDAPTGAYGFATGSTPLGLYEELVKIHAEGSIDFSQITAFNLDEYFPISPDNEQSYAYYMAKNLFDVVGVQNRNIPGGNIAQKECEAYDSKLHAVNRLELQILGIGTNGHIGFNEPADHFPYFTHKVELAESTIQSNAVNFADISQVPRFALTMGIGAIMRAKNILLLANGEKKADILYQALYGPITPQVPGSVLQLHPAVTVICDKAAAKKLPYDK